MQMLLRAPFGGRVESVRVEPGVQVDKGMPLVQLTAEPNGSPAPMPVSDPVR